MVIFTVGFVASVMGYFALIWVLPVVAQYAIWVFALINLYLVGDMIADLWKENISAETEIQFFWAALIVPVGTIWIPEDVWFSFIHTAMFAITLLMSLTYGWHMWHMWRHRYAENELVILEEGECCQAYRNGMGG